MYENNLWITRKLLSFAQSSSTSNARALTEIFVYNFYTMPRIRRNETSERATRPSTANYDSITDLRRRCDEEGLPSDGRRTTLVARLQQHAARNSSSAAPNAFVAQSTDIHTPATQFSALLTDAQLAQIESIVSKSVERSAVEIATNAARAAVQAMTSSSTIQSHPSAETAAPSASSDVWTNQITVVPDVSSPNPLTQLDQAQTTIPYGHGAHDIPAAYVKQIQSGEFFDLSKLLPNKFATATEDEPLILTLENSALKVKKSSPASQKITSIEQWTTAFTIYMSALTHKFPSRSQDLLQYMSLIRHAAQTHQGLGWCVYDHKFRRKAALNPSLKWSEIDQQLWLLIFTISPETLRREYPLFSNGPKPKNSNSSGAAKRGINTSNDFNKEGTCMYNPCLYSHTCNKCTGPHPGFKCGEHPSNESSHASKQSHKSSKSKH